ncbi:MAG: hypothetical protein R2845_08345 [Thermomicrobiales bacterium]
MTGSNTGTATTSITCTIGDLEADGRVVITLTRTTTPDDCGTLDNEATVTGSNEFRNETEIDDNTDDASITVLCRIW